MLQLRMPVSSDLWMKRLILVVSLALLSGCGQWTSATTKQASSLAEDIRELPFHFPCQRDTEGERVEGSPATYVPSGGEVLIGCILDQEGNGIAGATAGPDGEEAAATMTAEGWGPTGEDGRYLTPGIAHPGWYTVTADARGYEPLQKRVLIRKGQTAVLDFVLEPAL